MPSHSNSLGVETSKVALPRIVVTATDGQSAELFQWLRENQIFFETWTIHVAATRWFVEFENLSRNPNAARCYEIRFIDPDAILLFKLRWGIGKVNDTLHVSDTYFK